MKKMRVVQWTTGKVGKLALRGILDDPRLELVGVYSYSPEKAGKDAGELCGRPKSGVLSTNDIDALMALKPDAVIYTPFMADLGQAVKILESGANLISTNLFSNVGGVKGETREALQAACERGKSSFFVTGVSPGWINAVIAGFTAVCRDVERVSIIETGDCSVYESAETWLAMGMSLPKATPEVIATARSWLISFYDAVQRIAESLEFELDDLEFFVDYATTSQRVDLGWFVMEKDTIGAMRGGWNGKVGGRTVASFELNWYLTKHLNEGWTFNEDQYHLNIKGEPDIESRLKFIPPKHWGNHEWDTMTAMPAVNAIFNVQRAAPGVLTLKDVGLVAAPGGPWLKAKSA